MRSNNKSAIIEDFDFGETFCTCSTSGRTFHDIVQKFVDHKKAVKNISKAQERAYLAYLNDYVGLLGEDSIGSIAKEKSILTEWLNLPNAKNGEKISDATRNRKLAYATSFYHWLKREKLVTDSPCAYEEKRPEEKIRQLTFGQSEVERVATALLDRAKNTKKMNDIRNYLLWVFITSVGTRATETGLITRADVKIKLMPPMVEIRPENTKTGKGRFVPLPDIDPATWEGDTPTTGKRRKGLKTTFQAVLEMYWRKHVEMFPASAPLFCTTVGTPLTDSAIRMVLKPVMRECGITTGRVHDMRHYALTTLLEQNVSLGIIQQLAGHTTPTMTARYAVASPAAVATLVNAGLERARKSA